MNRMSKVLTGISLLLIATTGFGQVAAPNVDTGAVAPNAAGRVGAGDEAKAAGGSTTMDFGALDKDRNNTLSQAELNQHPTLKSRFSEIDQDRSGKISTNEMAVFMRENADPSAGKLDGGHERDSVNTDRMGGATTGSDSSYPGDSGVGPSTP